MQERLIENVTVVQDYLGRLIVSLPEDLADRLFEEGWDVRRYESGPYIWVYRYVLVLEPIEIPDGPVNLVIVRHFWRFGDFTGSKAYIKSAEKTSDDNVPQ